MRKKAKQDKRGGGEERTSPSRNKSLPCRNWRSQAGSKGEMIRDRCRRSPSLRRRSKREKRMGLYGNQLHPKVMGGVKKKSENHEVKELLTKGGANCFDKGQVEGRRRRVNAKYTDKRSE